MKKFIISGIKYLSYFVLLILSLDILFSLVLSYSIRHKGGWITTFENKKYDYIVLGNSRALDGFDISLIDQKTGLKGLNLALDGAGSAEMSIIYDYFSKNNSVDNVVLLIDDKIISNKTYNKKAIKHFLPLIWLDYRESFLSRNMVDNYKLPKYLYIPFFRYIEYSSEIGLREVIMSLFINKPVFDKYGFKPVKPKKGFADRNDFIKLTNGNRNLENLLLKIKSDDKNLIKLNLPYFNEIPIDFKVYGQKYGVIDYTNLIVDKTKFNDKTHLNREGAKVFSQSFASDMIEILELNN